MENTNLVLSEEERLIVADANFILTKNRIIQKVYDMFGEIANQERDRWNSLPLPVSKMEPKISRGENLLGLPWVMLDYPRYFTDREVLAVRVLFWWGNFFSITLHLKGAYQKQIGDAMINDLSLFQMNGWAIGVGEDPWNHMHETNVYTPLSDLNVQEFRSMTHTKSHLRFSKSYSLDHWNDLPNLLMGDRECLFAIISSTLVNV